jgi:hypothetical protein
MNTFFTTNVSVSMQDLGLDDPPRILGWLRNSTIKGDGSSLPSSRFLTRALLLGTVVGAGSLSTEEGRQARELGKSMVRSVKDAAKRGCFEQENGDKGCVSYSSVDLITVLRVLASTPRFLDDEDVRTATAAVMAMHAPESEARRSVEADRRQKLFVTESLRLLDLLVNASSASAVSSSMLFETASAVAGTGTALLDCDDRYFITLYFPRITLIVGRVPGAYMPLSARSSSRLDFTMEASPASKSFDAGCNTARIYMYSMNSTAYPSSFQFRGYGSLFLFFFFFVLVYSCFAFKATKNLPAITQILSNPFRPQIHIPLPTTIQIAGPGHHGRQQRLHHQLHNHE